jgi:hypothetical protein
VSTVGRRPRLVASALVGAVAVGWFSLSGTDDASAAPVLRGCSAVKVSTGVRALALPKPRGLLVGDVLVAVVDTRLSPWWDFDGEARPRGAAADVGAFEDSGG